MSLEGPVGREGELHGVDAFLDRMPAGLAVLALTGPAGIGKTTVWREGVRRAQARGYLVLTARLAQGEQSMSFSGLADLLDPVGQEAFDALAPVQRLAVDVALMRADACLSHPTVGHVGAEAMGPAEEAGILRVERGGRLRFVHPFAGVGGAGLRVRRPQAGSPPPARGAGYGSTGARMASGRRGHQPG